MLIMKLPRIPDLEHRLFDINQVYKVEEELLELIDNMDRVEPIDDQMLRLLAESWDVVQAIGGLFQILVSKKSFLPRLLETVMELHTDKLERKYKAVDVAGFEKGEE